MNLFRNPRGRKWGEISPSFILVYNVLPFTSTRTFKFRLSETLGDNSHRKVDLIILVCLRSLLGVPYSVWVDTVFQVYFIIYSLLIYRLNLLLSNLLLNRLEVSLCTYVPVHEPCKGPCVIYTLLITSCYNKDKILTTIRDINRI